MVIKSSLPGRARFKCEELKNNPMLIHYLEEKIKNLKGIIKVYSNVKTGNILLLYEEGIWTEEVLLSTLKEFMKNLNNGNKNFKNGFLNYLYGEQNLKNGKLNTHSKIVFNQIVALLLPNPWGKLVSLLIK